MGKKKYNHGFKIGFDVWSDNRADDVTLAELIEALEKRVEKLKLAADEVRDAFSCFDADGDVIPEDN